MAQILVTPQPDPNVRNLKNDKAQNDEEAKQKIEAIEARLHAGRGFRHAGAELFGGSADTRPMAAISASCRNRHSKNQSRNCASWCSPCRPASCRRSFHTQDGYRILKMISKEPAGQRDLSDPRVQQIHPRNTA